MKLFDLHGKTALVTGGSRGLGKGIAEGLAEAGATVIILSSGENATVSANELSQKGYTVYAVKCDISNEERIKDGFEEAKEKAGGRIDILVNNAGIQRRNKCEDFSLKDWDDVLNINLRAAFCFCQLAGREMLERGYGKIINIASMLSYFGGFTVPAYAASKGGIMQLTKALSNEWASRGVNVNAIAPGYMATEMNTALINDEGRNKEILSRIPAKRWGVPEDMKGLAIFLASPASDYISGAIIPVDGGSLGR